jgi:hypothetical protein
VAPKEKPRIFSATTEPSQKSKRTIKTGRLRENNRCHTQAAARESKDNPAPKLKVKKRPPKKAGPKSWRLGMMRWFGMVR